MHEILRVRPTDLASLIIFWVGTAAFWATLLSQRRSKIGRKPASRDRWSILGIVIQAVAIGLCAGPQKLTPWTPNAIPRMIAVALLMAATVSLFGWATRTMGRNWAIVAQTREEHELVTSGPFAYVSNPIYAALALFMGGLATASGRLPMLIFAVPLYLIGTMIRVRIEERLLQVQFGSAFDDYRLRVKRLVPGIF